MADATPAPAPKKLTKKELRILERQKAAAAAAGPTLTDTYGELPLIQSQERPKKNYKSVEDLNPELQGESFWVRGHLQAVRAKSKIAFITLREQTATIQGILHESDKVSRPMIKFAAGVSKESVVDVYVTLSVPDSPVVSTTQKDVELNVEKFFVVSKALPELPFQVEDAARPDALVKAEGSTYVNVGLETRLNSRPLDLRTPANQCIMRIQAAVSQLFREFLIQRNFVEIHTPKLVGGASESGANCFTLKYFDQDAALAQSPQTYKQMACAVAGLERVFEIGPVFRAENSNTHRHMCEFVGLDLEMTIKEHYHEVLEVFSDLFIYIFDGLKERYAKELATINEQYPFEPLKYNKPSLIINFEEGVKMLKEAGADQEPEDDLSTENEKWLGRLVKEKYDTDFYILDKFPLAVRPFYTMPDPTDKRWSNSYDMMIRGEEIVSGAQRVHDPKLLMERMDELGVPQESMRNYIDSFRLGALPHGGGGIGLERVVMLYLGLGNIRKASMFPRDPKRLFP
ncbi:aspartyl-tRNA synthetase, putative [Phytophthora infestans T30-4]|uniref:aspartate--tRNA ligase n=1 Tax=Phytophthora infestans (strain T30-4) TaxID=403677 RepID=D0NJ60_PHYIT|nr:aspartyl-tRNA synthetase, putative [Phytophthora infestans T30-4]EEY59578.1 aspartyl-tRNA synthetase, putative [Phytophthora infestans T30-4]|eukprot:XP_002900771.1 aspartyl-tRNA synthetase, putative [Phytophthora infestans T30-4]